MKKLIAVGAAAAVLTLAGCVADVPDPVTDPAALVETGALLQPQADAIIDETLTAMAAADSAGSLSGIGPRVGGSWVKLVREAKYAQVEAGVEGAVAATPDSVQAVYVTSSEDFPRILVAVSDTNDDISTPWIGMWVQDDINTPYQLRGWALMTPGAQLPEMPAAAVGAAQLDLDDESLGISPAQAVEQYLDVVAKGDDSEFTSAFADDSYRERLAKARDSLENSAENADGSYKEEYSSVPDGTFALQTAAGGALVFAPVSITTTFTVQDASVSVSEAEEALLGDELDDRVIHWYRDFVVLSIPPAGSEEPIAAVAAEHNLVTVTP